MLRSKRSGEESQNHPDTHDSTGVMEDAHEAPKDRLEIDTRLIDAFN